MRTTLLALFFIAAPILAQAARPVVFDDLDGVKTGQSNMSVSFGFSADGEHIAAERARRLRVFDGKTGGQLHDLGEGILPLWSPTGGRLAFYSLRSGAMQIWVWDAKTGETRQLTDLPGGIDPEPRTRIAGYLLDAFRFDWSPDGTRIVFPSRVASPTAPRPAGTPLILDQTTRPELTLSGLFAQPTGGTGGVLWSPDGFKFEFRGQRPNERLLNRLFIADVKAWEVKPLNGGRGHFFHPAFSPSGKQIAFAAIDEDAEIVFANTGDIRLHDIEAETTLILASSDGLKHRPRWSPDGSKLAYLVNRKFADHPEIRVADSKKGDISNRMRLAGQIHKYDWTHDGEGLLLSYDAEEGAKLGLARLGSGRESIQPLRPGVRAWWAETQDGSLVWAEGLLGSDVWVMPKGAAEPAPLLSLAPPEEDNMLQLGRVENIPYRTARGFALEGKLLYPPDYVARKKYPLIVDAYPLTSGGLWMHPMSGNQAWAAEGYMVFKPHRTRAPHVWVNCSGDSDFCAASKGPDAWDVMVDDVMSGVDELIKRGLIDPERMCLYGHSNGGGVVNYLVTQTDRFKCAASVAPVRSSNVGGTSLLSTGVWTTMTDWYGVSPLDDPAAYIKLSAVFHVKNVKTPMLLAVGDKDGSFLLSAIEMYNALRFAGKEVTLLRYPDQGHVFEGAGLRDLWKREMEFFARYLQPE